MAKMLKKDKQTLISKLEYEEYTVCKLLAEDRADARSKKYLMNMTGYSERELKEVIRKIRLKGIPVCSQVSNGGGYWLEWDKKEFGRFVAQQKIEVEGYQKSLQNLIDIYKSLKGDDDNELFV